PIFAGQSWKKTPLSYNHRRNGLQPHRIRIQLDYVAYFPAKLLWGLTLSIVATYTFVAFFNIGLGLVSWVYNSEVFPLKLRAQVASIGVAMNRVMNAAVSMSFISIYKTITRRDLFYVCCYINVSLDILLFFLPETKEEMEMVFSQKYSRNLAAETDLRQNEEKTMERGNKDHKGSKYAFACAVVTSMISIIFGYDTGVMSGAMIFIKEELEISDTQQEVLVGILNICALVGSLAAGRTADYIGRRYTITLASILFMVGSILMGYGPNYAILMLGRCVAGIGVGFALLVAPVYSAEISSAESRGFLSSLPELCIGIGILLGYVINYFLGKLSLELGWRLMLGIAAVPSLALAFGILRMPESPRWLIMQGRLGKAKEVLLQISDTEQEAELRFKDIKIAAGIGENSNGPDHEEIVQNNNGKGIWKELIVRPSYSVRWMLIAAVGIHFFEHATGIEAVMLYSPRIFKKAGVTTKDKLLLTTIGVGLTKVIFLIIATFLLDRVGRRRLLLVSIGGMICSLVVLGFSLTMVDTSHEKLLWALTLSIVATYIYVAFFNIGLGPVTWVYSSEIFPLKLRAQGASLGVAVNRLTNAAISMSFISIYKAITIGGAFFMFAGISVLAWLFFYFFLPETKGKSLEEMEMLFSKKNTRNVTTETDPRHNV
ncbi:putative polyol transporter 6, partial [Mucuna pruriens]